MKQYLIPLILMFFISCSSVREIVDISVEQSESIPKKLDIEGHWKFVSAVKEQGTPFLKIYPNPNTPAYEVGPLEPPYIGPDFIFEGDSAYQLAYPTYMYNRNAYSIDSGYLHFNHKWNTELFPLEWRDDTLFIYKPFYGKEYVKEGYVKTDLNDSVFSILKKHGVNYPELAGTFFLIRESSGSGEDGSDWEYVLDFPHELPDSILISREQFIEAVHNNYTLQVLTDGKPRDYTFVYRYGSFRLTPGEWYKGEDPGIHFERRETEH